MIILNKKNIPNVLTMSRGILALLIVVLLFFPYLSDATFFLFQGNFVLWTVYILFIMAVITDFLDGFLARKWNVVSNFGARFDPLFDKVLVFPLLIFIFLTGPIPQSFILILIVRDIISDILRSRLLKRNIATPAIRSAKYKTAFQMLMINFVFLYNIFPLNTSGDFPAPSLFLGLAIVSSFLAVFFSLWSGIIYIKRYSYLTKNLEKESSSQ